MLKKILYILLKRNFYSMDIIDVIFFSILEIINFSNLFMKYRTILIFLGIVIIRKSVLNYSTLKEIETIYFLSGEKVYKFILVDCIIKNFLFLITFLILYILNLSSYSYFLEGLYILNLLLFISFILKFAIPLKGLSINLILENLFRSFLYYFFFSILIFGIKFPIFSTITTLLILLFSAKRMNRTLNYYDINK